MAIVDPNELWPKLEQDGVPEVRKKLAMGVYAQNKKPIIEEWLRRKEKELDAPTYLYHECEAPKGKIFRASEVPSLEKIGWVDNPDKFGRGFRSRSQRILIPLSRFWLKHWKWIIGAVAVPIIIAIILS